jgi:outer membrane immunogenic protein
MKKSTLAPLALCIAFTVTESCHAESNFSGSYVQSGIGYGVIDQNSRQNVLAGNNQPPLGVGDLGNLKTIVGSIGFGHNWDINSNFILGVGADFSPSGSSHANFTVNSTVNQPASYGSTQFKNGKNFYLSPGYIANPDQVIYTKFGYTTVTALGSSHLLNASATLNGYTAGIGYKQALSSHLYALLEWKYIHFHSITSSTSVPYGGSSLIINSSGQPKGNDVIVGLGYKF